MKKALITGVSGQDGSYLAELLIRKGYKVYGLNRRKAVVHHPNLVKVQGCDEFELIPGDLLEPERITQIIRDMRPDELYNLAAQSFVPESWNTPVTTCQINALGTLYLLEAIRHHSPETHFYQASSSEQFGKAQTSPQTEETRFYPRSPYACSKVMAHNLVRNYRESYDLFCCNGILFNHESPRRGLEFVTRKITQGVARIAYGLQDEIYLGNLDVKRDWGHAQDYVEAMWFMLQHDTPDDFVIASGENYTVREFVQYACEVVDMPLTWVGKGINERGIDGEKIPRIHVSAEFFRPADVMNLLGDSTKARNILGWKPRHTFRNLVEDMVKQDSLQIHQEKGGDTDGIVEL